jgi:NAD+ synthase (glutamine-hydrolysing)
VLVYANAVGGQDGLIYDGGGFIFQNGRRVLDAPRFLEGWWSAVVDLDRTGACAWRTPPGAATAKPLPGLGSQAVPVISSDGGTADRSRLAYPAPDGGSFFLPPAAHAEPDPRDQALDDLFEALALGVKSYYEKTGAFTSLGIALSGGRDSMLTLLVAWRAAQLMGPAPCPSTPSTCRAATRRRPRVRPPRLARELGAACRPCR